MEYFQTILGAQKQDRMVKRAQKQDKMLKRVLMNRMDRKNDGNRRFWS